MSRTRIAQKVLVIAGTFALGSCDRMPYTGKKIIVADGEQYISCGSVAWVVPEGSAIAGGETVFAVSFTDANGLGQSLHGVKRVTVGDLPKLVQAPMSWRQPEVGDLDSAGKPYVEGATYSSKDGSEGKYVNGTWQPIMRRNTACDGAR